MSWKSILKQQSASPQTENPEELEIQVDSGSLSDACCGQSKNQLIAFFSSREHKGADEVNRMINHIENKSCEEVKSSISQIIAKNEVIQQNKRGRFTAALTELKQIMEDWESCDSRN